MNGIRSVLRATLGQQQHQDMHAQASLVEINIFSDITMKLQKFYYIHKVPRFRK